MTTQTDDTRRILEMLSQGKITVDAAARMTQDTSADREPPPPPSESRADPCRSPARLSPRREI